MSGHNKWSKIKHKKGAEDARKSKIFSKFARLIALESKKAGGNENALGLRATVSRARAENMPSENIERAIKKGISRKAGNLEEATYEAYGPEGCAIIIEVLTDNKNRTHSEIKQLLEKHGASFAKQGSALWAFEKKDSEWIPKRKMPLSRMGAEKLKQLVGELEESDDVQKVYINMN